MTTVTRADHYTRRFLDELRTIDDEYEIMSKLSNGPGILFGMDKLINRDKIENILQQRVSDNLNPDYDDSGFMDTGATPNNYESNVSFDKPPETNISPKPVIPTDYKNEYKTLNTNSEEDVERMRLRKEKKQKRLLQDKYKMLAYLDRMREKGEAIKSCDINSGYSEIKYETTRVRHLRRMKFGKHIFTQTLLDVIRLIEFLSTKIEIIDFHLDGWHKNVQYNLEEFDDVIEEIVEKYTQGDEESSSMSPEMKLGLLLLLSAVEHSTSNAGMSNGLGQIRSLFGGVQRKNTGNDEIDPDILKEIEREKNKRKI